MSVQLLRGFIRVPGNIINIHFISSVTFDCLFFRDLMHLVCLGWEKNTQMPVTEEAVCLSCHFKC